MERKFLMDLGLEKEAVDKVLDQNGAELTAIKTQLTTKDTEVKTLRGDLTAANTKIAEMEQVNVDDLQRQLDEEKNGRLQDRKDWNLRAALTAAGCWDLDYLTFKLGDKVEFAEDGSLKNSDALLESCKKDYASLFQTEQPPTGTGSMGNFARIREPAGTPAVTKEQFHAMGYEERAKLKAESPEVYETLKKE